MFDESGEGNDGTMYGSVSYTADRFGTGCSALWFDGAGYVGVPSSRSLKRPSSALTIAVWFKLADGVDGYKYWITICCKGDAQGEADDCPQYRMQATVRTVSINTEFTENYILNLPRETWYFYAYTFDGSRMRVYLNDQQVFDYDYFGTLKPNDMPLEIGRDLPGAIEYFHGAMDDLRIYDRALTPASYCSCIRIKPIMALPAAARAQPRIIRRRRPGNNPPNRWRSQLAPQPSRQPARHRPCLQLNNRSPTLHPLRSPP